MKMCERNDLPEKRKRYYIILRFDTYRGEKPKNDRMFQFK